jgi:hypothetical protein
MLDFLEVHLRCDHSGRARNISDTDGTVKSTLLGVGVRGKMGLKLPF